jgi:hypothetical protein
MLKTMFNGMLTGLAMASVLLAPQRAFAASSKGCVDGGFALLGLSGDQKTIVRASEVGATFLVKGKYIEFTVARRMSWTSPAADGRWSSPPRSPTTADLP